jgi:hypothetical protein
MKRLFLLSALLIAFAVNTSFSQSEEEMKKWMEYMTPGDMQKMLAKGTGTWKGTVTFWMAPGGEPTKSEATATSEMIFGGRYLVSKMSGNMWGMPFEGMAVEGYDNAAKVFVSSWIDNFGTGMMYMTGKWDGAAKQINYTGKMVDPVSGNWIDVRQVVTYTSETSTKMEMYGPGPDGKEFKTMEMISTKQ